MRSENLYFAAMLSCLLLAGCGGDNPWAASCSKDYSDPIQQLVEDKITWQSEPRSGPEQWDNYASDEYQSPQDIDKDRQRLQLELRRQKQAERLLQNSPLSLGDCLAYSLEFNDRVQASRAIVRSMGGEKLIAQSRFLPRLTYDLSKASVAQNVGDNLVMGIRGIQTLLEFGKDNPVDVALRELQREALFRYEANVARVLSQVRLRFFTILLKQRQLDERLKLRENFEARHLRMRKLEEARRVLEVDVLTARLNVLNEQARINSLEKEILRQKMDLLHAIGLPLNMTDFQLQGQHEKYDVPLEKSVAVAYRRSTHIAQARAAVFEQDRIVRQLVWEYFPGVRIQGGYRGRGGTAGAELQSTDGTYAADPFGEYQLKPWRGNTSASDRDWLHYSGSRWYWGMELELALFTGLERTGRFRREKALLSQQRHLLCDAVYGTELAVRKAYQTVLEREAETDILQETVRISRERLRVQERLKELGKITDNELETFRQRFFSDQDDYFEKQIQLVEAQENLRLEMRYFEPLPAKGNDSARSE